MTRTAVRSAAVAVLGLLPVEVGVSALPAETSADQAKIATKHLEAGQEQSEAESVTAGAPGANTQEEMAPVNVAGEVQPPVKIVTPQPRYTEEARMARIQGAVIIEAVVDEKGPVANVKVLKGLPMGLTESAVRTACRWP